MKRFAALLAALTILAVFPVTASASVTQFSNSSCVTTWNNSGQPKPFVCLAEENSYGGDKLILTASSDVTNLGTLTHTLAGKCSPKTELDTDNWNDCISSVWMKLGTSDSVCLYHHANYLSMIQRWVAPGSPSGGEFTYFDGDLGTFGGDDASSIIVQQSGQPCNSGGFG